MARFNYLILTIVAIIFLLPGTSDARQQSYELIPAPDLWYNDVDGIRAGVRLKGEVPGTFEDGPHRLDAGFWLSTWLPSLPVSYYLSFTEPISDWSEYGSEASGRLVSTVRTGYHIHGLAFAKRWQQGFDERNYIELDIAANFEKRFDHEYTHFPVLWSDDSKLLNIISFEVQKENPLGWYSLDASAGYQFLNGGYGLFTASAVQNMPLHELWGFRFRLYSGMASSGADPEYLYSRSSAPAREWMNSGLTRAKGTIPHKWVREGNFQVAGGANLRGYMDRDALSFVENDPFLFNSMLALNAEFNFFNPVNLLFNRLPYASEFLTLQSYLFFDAGTSMQLTENDPDGIFADAGAGFSLSLNIPDYLGKPRGFVLRYELPVWLSEPGDEDPFRVRHLFAVGASISF